MSSVVTVTGATGYVGTFVVKALLEAGHTVRATVRDPRASEKNRHLTALAHASARLTLMHGDLEEPGSFDEAVQGAEFVIHTASAVMLNAKDPQKSIVDVAVGGTRQVLEAARKSPSVKRVVVTSSISAAISTNRPRSYVYSEGDWNESATLKSDPYGLSKVLAEREARRIAEGAHFSLVTILPGLVLGPVLAKQHLSTSPSVLTELLLAKMPGVPNLHFQVVDVRDVATAHLRAMNLPKPAPRYVCVAGELGMREMARALRSTCPEAPIPRLPLPDALLFGTSLFDPRLSFDFLRRNLGSAPKFDTSRADTDLEIKWISPGESVVRCAQSMTALGLL